MTWSRPMASGPFPPARCAHTMAGVAGNLYVFGGFDGTKMISDLYILQIDCLRWSKAVTTGKPPSQRAGHTATAVGNNKLLVFGGGDGSKYLNDIHLLDTEKMEWTYVIGNGATPPPRSRHTATLVDKKLFVVGGGDDSRVYNDVYILDTETMTWSKPPVSGTTPAARWGHTTSLVDQSLILFGGHDGTTMLNDVYSLNTSTMTWTSVAYRGALPSPRAGHTTNLVGRHLVVFAGGNGNKILNDLHLLEVDSATWSSPTPPDPPPSFRCAHTTVLMDEKRLIVYGGGDSARRFKDLYILDVEKLLKHEEMKLANQRAKLKTPSERQRNPSDSHGEHRQPTHSNIVAWLEGIGMAAYSPTFLREEIDTDVLMYLTEQHLIEQLGVHTVGARLRILRAIQHLPASSHLPTNNATMTQQQQQQQLPQSILSIQQQLHELLSATAHLTASVQALYLSSQGDSNNNPNINNNINTTPNNNAN